MRTCDCCYEAKQDREFYGKSLTCKECKAKGLRVRVLPPVVPVSEYSFLPKFKYVIPRSFLNAHSLLGRAARSADAGGGYVGRYL